MNEAILGEQLAYYRARAQEYDESVQQTGRFAAAQPGNSDLAQECAQVVEALHAHGPFDHVLELACGTGIWTRELARVSREITALDGSPEMLALNRANIAASHVHYQCADLFAWQPDRTYDLVFFAFWLSHVPPDALGRFLDLVQRAVRPNGRVFLVDEPHGGRQVSGPNESGMYQTRTLHDGQMFRIIKVYYDPMAIAHAFEQRGFSNLQLISGSCVFSLTATRAA